MTLEKAPLVPRTRGVLYLPLAPLCLVPGPGWSQNRPLCLNEYSRSSKEFVDLRLTELYFSAHRLGADGQ